MDVESDLRRATAIARARSLRAGRRAIDWVVSTASTSYHGRWYYANRWHPHETMMRRAHEDTVDYIEERMPDALIRRGADDVLRHASKLRSIDGLILEFGVRTGHTIGVLSKANRGRPIHGFDSFEGLPEPWSGWSLDRGAFGEATVPAVGRDVELHVGWFDDTLPAFLETHDGPAALIHVDSDIYSSAKTVLDLLAPRCRPGTIIVFNEYFNYPGWRRHEHRAFQEFCAEHDVAYEYRCWGFYEVAVELTSIGDGGDGGGR